MTVGPPLVLLVLLAGLASFASPCFLPVVPVFVGYLTGSTAPGAGRRRAAVGHCLAFIAAFAAVFIAGWAAVGLVGWAVGDFRRWLRVAAGAVVVVLGLHMARLVTVPVLDRVLALPYSPDGAQPPTLRRSVALGLAFAFGWTPCVGPVLGGVLGLATTTDSVGVGAALLAVYAAGLGLPFVLVCAGASGLLGRLRWLARHRRAVDAVTGALLVGVGFLMMADLLGRWSALVPIPV